MTTWRWPELLGLTLTDEGADTRWGRGHRPTVRSTVRHDQLLWRTACCCGCDRADSPVSYRIRADAMAAADERLRGAEYGTPDGWPA
ncbi:MAG TPA: hypothetical protein VFJ94_03925 [Intrasporangium sp.]|uniref:hypothetical protein n=1 Tax=Intrasporangium sp. TaxID=1925024 RepID=UPI002D778B75|nr:hypothetical protein [Intrasporangium sp.]HET7397651.1 hypothetical protein [Intrasporangium sp.]